MELKRAQIVDLEITDYAFGGRGIAKLKTDAGEYVVFVDNAFPGQLVRAQIEKKRKRHAEAKLVDVIRHADCEQTGQFQQISGSPYIFVPIDLQEKVKKESTLQVFQRIGGLSNVESLFDTFISSPNHYFYRNKMEYSFSTIEHVIATGEEKDEAFALGFKRRGTWWKVESLDRPSGLFDEEWESFIHELRLHLQESGLPAWHPPRKEGFFRHIVVRKSFAKNQLLINLVTSSEGMERFDSKAFAQFVLNRFGDRIAGIQHTINDNVADRAKIENGKWELLYGKPFVVENLLGLEFEISMESFFQTNPASAERLYTKALDYVFEVSHNDGDYVMDLFCGTGTIGQLASKRNTGVQIIGVDIVEEAIQDAIRNAERNNMKNVRFFAADVGKFLFAHPEYVGKIKTIVLDPPRAGIAPKTLNKVIALGAERIVYISCNPATQARDTTQLAEAGYQVLKITLVDQFPHTGHIESIILYERK
jgi:23S rRNA (uracil-5-)-methyltransferase RumA